MAGKDAWNADLYSSEASFVFTSVSSLVKMLKPQPGERILDLGCGTGELSCELRDVGCELVCIDSSSAMVEKAKEKGLDARVISAYDMEFDEEFDAVFSNAALHWMRDDPRRVLQNVRRSLKPNGRFVAEFGGEGNIESIVNALAQVFSLHRRNFEDCNPWYFPSKEEYVDLLRSERMEVKEAQLFRRDTPCPAGLTGWLDIFGEQFFTDLTPSEKQQYYAEIKTAMEPLHFNQDGTFMVDYKRLRIHAVKPSSA